MTVWTGDAPDACQVCQADLDGVMFDASTPWGWACVCRSCFAREGLSLGTGRGQRYERQEDGTWLKTGG